MANYLITGCAGFIGYHLTKELLSNKKNYVVGVDDFSRNTSDEKFKNLSNYENFKFFELDLTKSSNLDKLPLNVDYVVHLAAINGTQNFYSIPYDVAVSCAIPTWNLIEKYSNSPIKKFVFAGTPESYAAGIKLGIAPIPTPEDVPLTISRSNDVRWSYAAGKTYSESLLYAAALQNKLRVQVLRLHNIYGPRMGPYHFIPDFITRIRKGIFELYGAEDTRSFLYVSDAVSDILELIEHETNEYDIFNIGSQREVQIKDVANEIMSLMKLDGQIEIFASPIGSVSRRVPDTSKIDELLGERLRTELNVGLKFCIDEISSSETNKHV